MRFVSMDDSPMLRKQVSTGPISGMQGCPQASLTGVVCFRQLAVMEEENTARRERLTLLCSKAKRYRSAIRPSHLRGEQEGRATLSVRRIGSGLDHTATVLPAVCCTEEAPAPAPHTRTTQGAAAQHPLHRLHCGGLLTETPSAAAWRVS
jgi:hypothetical protein